MKLFAIAAVVAVCFASVAVADDSKVLVLSPDNFKDTIESNDLTLVEFYAPWCGHCKALAPEYDQASLDLEGKDAGVLAKVDCTEHRDLCSEYGVRGFPTLKLFRKEGGDPTDYDSARKADAIVKWMVKQNQPAVTDIADADKLSSFTKADSVTVVAFASDASQAEAFTKVANQLRNEYSFGLVKDSSVASAEGVSAPGIKMYRDFDDGDVVFDGDASDSDALKTWVIAKSFPLVGTIGPENYAKYVDRGLNFVWFFLDQNKDDQKSLVEDVVKGVAKDFADKLSFVQLDGVRWSEHAKSFGLSGGTPGIVIEDRDARKNYVFDESADITADALRAHVQGYVDGTLAPTLKSEEIPENNDGPVKVVVGKTFDEIVLDDSKDVLVEFYAPWCGHCKSLAPKYEELGKKFEDVDTVVIAKIDATANDSPADVQGFPTLIFYPANDKSNTKTYNGDRTAEAMETWVRENAATLKGSGHEEL